VLDALDLGFAAVVGLGLGLGLEMVEVLGLLERGRSWRGAEVLSHDQCMFSHCKRSMVA
jgi:hypothetical protein